MAARWLLNQLSGQRPGITNTIPDRPRRSQFPNDYIRGIEQEEVPQYIHLLRASNGGSSSSSSTRPRSTSMSNYAVHRHASVFNSPSHRRSQSGGTMQSSNEVPLHLRTDPHVKNEVPAHLRTDKYNVGRQTYKSGGEKNTLDSIHSTYTLSYLNKAQSEEQMRHRRHKNKKEAARQAKKRDEERTKIAREKKLRQQRLLSGNNNTDDSGSRTLNSIRYDNLPRVNAKWVTNDNTNDNTTNARAVSTNRCNNHQHHNNRNNNSIATYQNGIQQHLNVKEVPFSAVVVDTFAASTDEQISVMAGTEVVVIDNRQSQTLWLVTVNDKTRETGWIPSSILLFDEMPTPRGNNGNSGTTTTTNNVGTNGNSNVAWSSSIDRPRRLPFTSNNDYTHLNQNANRGSARNSDAPTFRPIRGDNPIFYVKAKQTRVAQTVRELDLSKGEIIMVTDCQQSSYWWYGHREFNPEEAGWFPLDIVRKVSDEERLRLSGISNVNYSTYENAYTMSVSSPSKNRERRDGSKYAVESIVTPSNRSKHTKSFSFNDENKVKTANEGRNLMQSGIVVESERVLRRFVSKSGTEWTELKSKDDDGVVYVDETSNQWQRERPTSAKPLRRFSSSGGTHWAELVDEKGRHYFHNTETGGRTIIPPKVVTNNLRRVSSAKGSTWEEMVDKETGQKYWYNIDKQTSTWDDPMTYKITDNATGSKDKIENMETSLKSLRPPDSGARGPECPICLERIIIVKDKVTTKCGHSFHLDCLNTLKKYKSTCPMCRQKL
jgi:hypothetical protein